MTTTPRKQRANGVASRRKIVEAALEIASERGYDGTSISAVSERSGLPASSIYWHFANKDELIAAVIEHSFERWLSLQPIPADTDTTDTDTDTTDTDTSTDSGTDAAFTASMRRAGGAIAHAPDFLRLGLMLALERRPEEPAARTRFLEIRRRTRADLEAYHRRIFGDLSERDLRTLGRMAMAAADGLFIAREIDDEDVDLGEALELTGVALAAVAAHLRSSGAGPG